ncbi:hypothetical protein B566_EDAN016406 [Ephemera danica]|nr:hypothetical protein B566_EDAN016406 [Ephemera danica]
MTQSTLPRQPFGFHHDIFMILQHPDNHGLKLDMMDLRLSQKDSIQHGKDTREYSNKNFSFYIHN